MTLHLSFLVWAPAAFALAGAVLGGRSRPSVARALAVLGTLTALGYGIALVIDYKSGGGLQYVTDRMWIRELGIHYKIGVDGLNLFLVLLTSVLFTATTLWAMSERRQNESQFWLHLGLGHTFVLGALVAQDLALFVAFFDLMLIPFFFLTLGWGAGEREERVRAVTKLVIYTLVGSLLMLTAAIALAVLSSSQSGRPLSFAFSDLSQVTLTSGSQNWIFLCFAAAFLVKMPSFPFHGWMPDGYRSMPLPVLAVFSGVLSKVAAYGFLRIVVPILPDASVHFQTLMLLIALGSVLYGSVMAFSVTNVRLILGYSSIAQLGFIVLGVFSLTEQGAQGAILQSVNHGLVVAPAFFIAGLVAARCGSEDLRDMGGVAFRAPVLTTLFLIVAMANLAIPGSSNFVGEFLILLGLFNSKLAIAVIAFTGVALASVYTLRFFIRAMHNRVGPHADSRDISVRDAVVLVPLVLCILALAVYPQLALKKGEASVKGSVAAALAITKPSTAAAAPGGAAPGAGAEAGAVPSGGTDPATGGTP
ncbi:MAG: proton-translocating NADH-quinone oxidoreductase, chain [Solirubrobacterales bacterium]|nr:proton-translocating NADH-quinone oxidoreductase, chain [Solirubrobacterales bacterium]